MIRKLGKYQGSYASCMCAHRLTVTSIIQKPKGQHYALKGMAVKDRTHLLYIDRCVLHMSYTTFQDILPIHLYGCFFYNA